MLAVLAVAVLRFVVSPFEADTSGAGGYCSAGPHLERLRSIRLYRMPCYVEPPPRIFLREKPAQPGPDTLQVDDSACASYFITVVDSAGNESCEAGITVGTPSVSVGFVPLKTDVREYHDIQSRRLEGPPRNGIYFVRYFRNGKLVYTEKLVALER